MPTKVARVIEERELDGMGQSLEAAWTDEQGERTSLRDLADEFNEMVLQVALRDAGAAPLDTEVASMYETLQSDSNPEVTRARRRLEREGVDPDELTRDFVTHQAVHTYLTEVCGATAPTDDENRSERKIDTVEKLRARVSAVTESALSSLSNADELDSDMYEVLVDVRVVCQNCGRDSSFGELVRRGGCDCGAQQDGADEHAPRSDPR